MLRAASRRRGTAQYPWGIVVLARTRKRPSPEETARHERLAERGERVVGGETAGAATKAATVSLSQGPGG